MDHPVGSPRAASTKLEALNLAKPNSHLLSDRLRESRAKASNSRRRTDFGPQRTTEYDDVFLAEAEKEQPPLGGSITSLNVAPESSTKATKPNGIREMDEKMAQLEKLNFDLKMEVFHRRQREEKLKRQMTDMADQVVKAQKLYSEHAELLQINERLIKELEKRDDAVKEAVELILDLETKTETLQEQASMYRPSTHSDSGYGGFETPKIIPPSIERHTDADRLFTPSTAVSLASPSVRPAMRSQARVPSFVSDGQPSTQALRDAYLDPSKNLRPVKSFMSIVSEQDSTHDRATMQDPGSPRLSVLSESSFPSIYGKPKRSSSPPPARQSPVRVHDDYQRQSGEHQSSIKKVSKWMDTGNGRLVSGDSNILLEAGGQSSSSKTARSVPNESTSTLRDERKRQIRDAQPHSVHQDTQAQILGDQTMDETLYEDYEDYPNGGSIDTGTPSRFQIRHTSPPASNMMFNGDGIDKVVRRPPRRRISSIELRSSPLNNDRPAFQRSETSPQLAPHQSTTSPYLEPEAIYTSGSHVVLERPESTRSQTSPALSDASRRKHSRPSWVSQTKQKLLRRLSNSQSDSPSSTRSYNSPVETLTDLHQSTASKRRPTTANSPLSSYHANVPQSEHEDDDAAFVQRSDSHHSHTQPQSLLSAVGMHYATPTEAARRRSVDHVGLRNIQQQQYLPSSVGSSGKKDAANVKTGNGLLQRNKSARLPEREPMAMSRNGAQAAWESGQVTTPLATSGFGGGLSRSGSARDVSRDAATAQGMARKGGALRDGGRWRA